MHRATIGKLIALILLLFMLAGCSRTETSNSVIDSNDNKTSYEVMQISSEFVLASENNNFKLFIKGITGEVKIVEKSTNTEWYSNPQNRNNDIYAINQVSKEKLISQVDLEYNNVTTHGQSVYSSYADGINNNPITIDVIDNGVRVNFAIGKKPIIYLAPEIISIERAQQIRSKLNEDDLYFFDTIYKKVSLNDFKTDADRALKLANYPILEKRDVFIAQMQFKDPAGLGENRFASTYLLKKISNVFKSAGYTIDDLNADDKENGSKQVHDPDNLIYLSVEYRIDNDGFIATIPKDSIKFDKNNIQLTKITLLPYFGSANDSKSGYIFVPDGSGALIYLNNNKKQYGSYSKPLYGRDKTILMDELSMSNEHLYLPVFGIKANETAFLGIIEKGDAVASISADISGKISQENTVNAKFTVNTNSEANNQGLSAALGIRYQNELLDSDLQIRYVFMNDDKANYTNMALSYQDYLINKKMMVKQNYGTKIPLYINTIGAIISKKSILGIPVERPLPLTTYKQSLDILKQLEGKGVNDLILQISNWCNNADINTPFNKIDVLNELGGVKDLNNLIKYTQGRNIDLYAETKFQYVSRNKIFSGYNPKSDASRTLDNIIANDYSYNMATYGIEKDTARTIISPKKYSEMIDDFIKDYSRYNNKGISLGALGKDLNPDYRDTLLIDRQKSAGIVANEVEDLHQKGYKIAIDGGNIYSIKGASIICNIPDDSSNESICDEIIPFYQIVLHGIVPYTSEPLNMSAEYDTDVLKALETGSIPYFQWIYEENDILTDTNSNFYSVNYGKWINEAVILYNKMNDALSQCQNSTITSHEAFHDGTVKVAYSNGTVIIINYSYNKVVVDNLTVDPRDYLLLKGDER